MIKTEPKGQTNTTTAQTRILEQLGTSKNPRPQRGKGRQSGGGGSGGKKRIRKVQAAAAAA